MKKVIYSIVASGLILACGCQTTPALVAIQTEPADAEIYVDGRHCGNGAATCRAIPNPGRPAQVTIRHPDYEPFSTVIKPKLYAWAPVLSVAGFLAGVLMVANGNRKVPEPQTLTELALWPVAAGVVGMANFAMIGGGICVMALSLLPLVKGWYFDKAYSFKLEKKVPAKTDTDGSRSGSPFWVTPTSLIPMRCCAENSIVSMLRSPILE